MSKNFDQQAYNALVQQKREAGHTALSTKAAATLFIFNHANSPVLQEPAIKELLAELQKIADNPNAAAPVKYKFYKDARDLEATLKTAEGRYQGSTATNNAIGQSLQDMLDSVRDEKLVISRETQPSFY